MNQDKKYEEGSIYYHISEMCFEAVVSIRKMNGEEDANEFFEDISDERKEILFDTIDRILRNSNWSAKDEHDLWMQHKINTGWVYGEKTNRPEKVHNCMVSFDRLSVYQKAKDEIVISIIKSWVKLLTQNMMSKKIDDLREDCN